MSEAIRDEGGPWVAANHSDRQQPFSRPSPSTSLPPPHAPISTPKPILTLESLLFGGCAPSAWPLATFFIWAYGIPELREAPVRQVLGNRLGTHEFILLSCDINTAACVSVTLWLRIERRPSNQGIVALFNKGKPAVDTVKASTNLHALHEPSDFCDSLTYHPHSHPREVLRIADIAGIYASFFEYSSSNPSLRTNSRWICHALLECLRESQPCYGGIWLTSISERPKADVRAAQLAKSHYMQYHHSICCGAQCMGNSKLGTDTTRAAVDTIATTVASSAGVPVSKKLTYTVRDLFRAVRRRVSKEAVPVSPMGANVPLPPVAYAASPPTTFGSASSGRNYHMRYSNVHEVDSPMHQLAETDLMPQALDRPAQCFIDLERVQAIPNTTLSWDNEQSCVVFGEEPTNEANPAGITAQVHEEGRWNRESPYLPPLGKFARPSQSRSYDWPLPYVPQSCQVYEMSLMSTTPPPDIEGNSHMYMPSGSSKGLYFPSGNYSPDSSPPSLETREDKTSPCYDSVQPDQSSILRGMSQSGIDDQWNLGNKSPGPNTRQPNKQVIETTCEQEFNLLVLAASLMPPESRPAYLDQLKKLHHAYVQLSGDAIDKGDHSAQLDPSNSDTINLAPVAIPGCAETQSSGRSEPQLSDIIPSPMNPKSGLNICLLPPAYAPTVNKMSPSPNSTGKLPLVPSAEPPSPALFTSPPVKLPGMPEDENPSEETYQSTHRIWPRAAKIHSVQLSSGVSPLKRPSTLAEQPFSIELRPSPCRTGSSYLIGTYPNGLGWFSIARFITTRFGGRLGRYFYFASRTSAIRISSRYDFLTVVDWGGYSDEFPNLPRSGVLERRSRALLSRFYEVASVKLCNAPSSIGDQYQYDQNKGSPPTRVVHTKEGYRDKRRPRQREPFEPLETEGRFENAQNTLPGNSCAMHRKFWDQGGCRNHLCPSITCKPPIGVPPLRWSCPMPHRAAGRKPKKLKPRLDHPHRKYHLFYPILAAGLQNANSHSAGSNWQPSGSIHVNNPPGFPVHGQAFSNSGSTNEGVIWSGQGPGPGLYPDLGASDTYFDDTTFGFNEQQLRPPNLSSQPYNLDDLIAQQLCYTPPTPVPLSAAQKYTFVPQSSEAVDFNSFQLQTDLAGFLKQNDVSPVFNIRAAFMSSDSDTPTTIPLQGSSNLPSGSTQPVPPLDGPRSSDYNAGFEAGCAFMIQMFRRSQSIAVHPQSEPTGPLTPNLPPSHTAPNLPQENPPPRQLHADTTAAPSPQSEPPRRPTTGVDDNQTQHFPAASTSSQAVLGNDKPSDSPNNATPAASSSEPEVNNQPSTSFSASQLPQHGRAKKIHKCDACDKIFQRRYKLNDHMKSHHGGGKGHTCDFPGCGESFTNRANMRRHQKNKHGSATHEGDSPTEA